ncbi:type VI secretion system ImpA family N-terminal domain-containing protein [Pseudomonas sp. KNUC1026]|uniref:type VI secretion system ImpA family N-terminal domain-containing protein n=1 Tax=Pseudomonas sp. KNUC1026 TaxID=2893890 RepID=UPI001F2D0A44|nr:type VI secretion system ImpA family N-terminal domain-containing protein [Pseudomonas sp. KNUC1026]UFH51065.1 type VI secretion system ImpA family N-terminal domain-containing protein [Pseudomonas sp. KNUC1026]
MTPLSLLTLGGDPRRCREFARLREALAPLAHPACPDVDWPQVRACAQALLQAHGAELHGLRALALAHAWCREPQAAAHVIRGTAQLMIEHSASLWPSESHLRQVLIDQWCEQLLVWSRQAAREEVWVLSPALAALRQALEATLRVVPPALHTLLARSERRCVPISRHTWQPPACRANHHAAQPPLPAHRGCRLGPNIRMSRCGVPGCGSLGTVSA